MKKRVIVPIICLTAAALTACQKSPDSSIVKNKDLDKMIEQAEDGNNGIKDVTDIIGEYETYKTSLKDDSLHVSVNVDAKVEIPKNSQLSIFRVKQKKIGQDMLDKIKKEFIDGETLYDGSVLSMKTRRSLEIEIKGIKDCIEDVRKNDDYDEAGKKVYIDEYQAEIDKLQNEYENAPSEIAWNEYPSDGTLHKVKELTDKKAGSDFYKNMLDFDADGDIYFGVTDGKNGNYKSIYLQNNVNYGNCIRYGCNKNGYVKLTSVMAGDNCNLGMWNIEEAVTEENLKLEVPPDNLVENTEVSANITQQQAKNKADEFLKNIGLDDFNYSGGGLCGEIVNSDANSDGKIEYRRVYILKYLRSIDGVYVYNESGSKLVDEWRGDNYVKKEWDGENVQIIINDDGIVGFYYSVPLEIVEKVVDKSNLKTFEEIRGIFEQMVVVTNAQKTSEESVSIDIDRVILRYTRISEPDSFDTGLLVPVWDFMGSVTNSNEKIGDKKDTCVMTINAIDGSIIDKELGY